MAKKGNLDTPPKTKAGKPGGKSTPNKTSEPINVSAGFAAIAAIRFGGTNEQAIAAAKSQRGFKNPPATPASTPNPSASAPASGVGYTMPAPSHLREMHGGRQVQNSASTPTPQSGSFLQRLRAAYEDTPSGSALLQEKRLIADVHAQYNKSNPPMSLDEFKASLEKHGRMALARVDLVGALTPDEKQRNIASEISRGYEGLGPTALHGGELAKIATMPQKPASAPNPAATAPASGGFSAPAPSHFNLGAYIKQGIATAGGYPSPGGDPMPQIAATSNQRAWKQKNQKYQYMFGLGSQQASQYEIDQTQQKIDDYNKWLSNAQKQERARNSADKISQRIEKQDLSAAREIKRQEDREEKKLQDELDRRGGGRDDGVIDVTSGAFNSGFNANQKIKELAAQARARQSTSFNFGDVRLIRRGINAAIVSANEMKPINDAQHQLEPFLKLAEYGALASRNPIIMAAVFSTATIARGVAAFRESRWQAVQSRLDVQRALYSANDPMAELFANKTAPERALAAMDTFSRLKYNLGFTDILDAEIRQQTSERNAAYASTKGNLAAYGIDFAPILAQYAAEKGIDPSQVTAREQHDLLSKTLENAVMPMVGSGREALYTSNEVEEMIPSTTTWGGDRKAVRETMKQKYFNLALEGKTRYGDYQTDYNASQQHQRVWWNNNSPEFRRKFDVDSRESQQQAKAIRKRHTQGF